MTEEKRPQEHTNEDNLPLRADDPHHFVRHGDCTFKYEEGPGPEEARMLREALLNARVEDLQVERDFLNDQVQRLQEEIVRLKTAPGSKDNFREAYIRMRENFQGALRTIRNLEEELHQFRVADEEPKTALEAVRLPPSFLRWARAEARACEASGWPDHSHVAAGLTLKDLKDLLEVEE